jgi:uncharacterized LabA/DUF88 family protein
MSEQSKRPTTYAFIDSQNLNLGIQRMGWKMDWRRFRQFLNDKYNVSNAYMFIGYLAENESLYEHMHELGFLVVLKPTVDMMTPREVADTTPPEPGQPVVEKVAEDKPPVKGNVDADLVLYAMKEIPNYEKAIIVSGDGDFHGLIEYLAQQGKLAQVLTPNWQYSSLLKEFESYIVRLDQQRRQLEYHDRKKK